MSPGGQRPGLSAFVFGEINEVTFFHLLIFRLFN